MDFEIFKVFIFNVNFNLYKSLTYFSIIDGLKFWYHVSEIINDLVFYFKLNLKKENLK